MLAGFGAVAAMVVAIISFCFAVSVAVVCAFTSCWLVGAVLVTVAVACVGGVVSEGKVADAVHGSERHKGTSWFRCVGSDVA